MVWNFLFLDIMQKTVSISKSKSFEKFESVNTFLQEPLYLDAFKIFNNNDYNHWKAI